MSNTLKTILRALAKLTLARYQPRVVAITGSVGKTSTKEAIATVLGSKYSTRASFDNYNNEIGVPLTIIGEQTGGRNIVLWAIIFIKAIFKLIANDYPKVLVLELGTDRPGDISYLVRLLGKIDVAVLTDIGISHLEFFAHPESLAKEKLSLIKKLTQESVAVLNFDNPKILEAKSVTNAKILGYGFDYQASLLISDFHIINSEGSIGANFKVHYKGNVVPFFLPNALGKPAIYAAVAAVGVGSQLDMNMVQISEALKNYQSAPGRLRLLDGIKHTKIIDDTYNAAPDSVKAALDVLNNIAIGRKLAAIGDMAELGVKSDWGHREIAGKIVEAGVNLVFLVGPKTKLTANELKKKSFGGKIIMFENSDMARLPIQNALIEGDTILVKGSQSARMEKIVKEIMADPEHAPELLVRQGEKWA
ncbi:MAG: hypothetical protein A3I07_01730 [Candidatus Doudnabacteria bacterium RIFCSPLOWO2_02_FULL_42_9]|uniref:UDP-N-acetylmuramoyl-tripeptide--D-alanyl-D-alanine ligase n=1 Tax=Candidatus Doudnabacteria bacterium RIFCSPHIGHO2_01_FULL_41_86 TaxID=1817821 RepID=A0A1F5N7R9_9BACT|nr:MAG: hypothetical protein A2717_03595 [Candidatus Doudnabacteria bacterium RIFCSPHIGHO2_01_FULL_41_86]OGE74758.1 MAG: hypothetical protein A3K07_03190 [Candidatus Doudnabacteria bacterium RIFCSPHIGHO2_01_43_10]OGE85725.1 MAG: hypothetical protein A3E28_02925 [Candidatus Doudnabacteria bacterium RIFCSPHIGHO2_12_FULL_42_22]OGE87221.1 MAG: hypothetical protein A3C49_00555 [Candidatus Doudnabacteria bacterium RIFCSPHIGHO2_02_FULL_42_25]OGE92058.1 MAG: hypothetical protein A2895_00430 [Candidatus